jgi:hypothetical protein
VEDQPVRLFHVSKHLIRRQDSGPEVIAPQAHGAGQRPVPQCSLAETGCNLMTINTTPR